MIDVLKELQDLAAKNKVNIPAVQGVITSQQTSIQNLKDQIAALQAAGVDSVKLQGLLDTLNGQSDQLKSMAATTPVTP